MKNWKDALIGPTATLINVMRMLDEVALQIAIVVDEDGCLLGTVTDGDLRRGLLSGRNLNSTVDLVMNTTPFISSATDEREDIIDVMQARDLQHIPLVDERSCVLGLFTIDEILRNPELPNWAVIMAGGVGSRLYPLTEHLPKPLLNIGERPILETIISHLKKSGFDNILLSVNYKAEMIREYFGDGDNFGIHIEYLTEDEPLGTAGALGLIDKQHPLLEQPFLVMNGDVLTEMDFSRIIHFNDSESALATMCVREYFNEIPFGVVQLDNHKLVALEEKPIQSFFINAGVYALAPRILEYIEPGHHCDITEVFARALEDKRNVTAYPITEYWRDVGSHEDFDQAQKEYHEIFGKQVK
jgi:dTDP-glucose pyrophosphorylase